MRQIPKILLKNNCIQIIKRLNAVSQKVVNLPRDVLQLHFL